MKRSAHRMKLALMLAICALLAASTAFACKADYCSGSKAPTTLDQVGGPQVYWKNSGGGGASGPKYPCTSYGDQEKTIALQALQAGHDICQVADMLNSAQPPDYKSLPGDTACVCYPDGPYVGCREFYMAGPDDGSFTPDNYQSHPDLWFSVSRCDPACTDPNGCMP